MSDLFKTLKMGLNRQDSERIEKQQKKQQEYKLIGKRRRIPGLNLFSYNTVTKELKLAPVEKNVTLGLNGSPDYKTNIKIEKDCIYLQALNIDNARRKLMKKGIIKE